MVQTVRCCQASLDVLRTLSMNVASQRLTNFNIVQSNFAIVELVPAYASPELSRYVSAFDLN